MKKVFLVVAVIVAAVVIRHFFFINSASHSVAPVAPPSAAAPANSSAVPVGSISPATTAATSAVQPAAAAVANFSPAAITPVTPSPVSSAPEFTDVPPATVLENARVAVHAYGEMFGGNPVGTNPEITSALNGNNPRQVKFLPPDSGMRINNNGELIDPWGTPFFFHQLSGSVTEIRSAGPDRRMWTSDDLVTQ